MVWGSAIALCCWKGNSGGWCHASSNRPPLSKRLNPLALDSLLKKSREPRDFLNRLLRLPGALVERSGRIHSDGGNQPREQDARKSKQRFFSGDRNPGPELFPATGTRGHGGCGEYFLQKITKIAKGGWFTDVAFFYFDFGFFREVHVAVLNSDFTPSRIRWLKTEDPGMGVYQKGRF